ncbi:hypothetical protein HDU98_002741 [Podochytrium sp. JEL0797]|nr:hypothetical protein HDU98_002741 [Podochytrium sp. JEL0797]
MRSSSFTNLTDANTEPAVSSGVSNTSSNDSFSKHRSASVGRNGGAAVFDFNSSSSSCGGSAILETGGGGSISGNSGGGGTLRRKSVHFTNPGRPMVEFWDCSDSKIATDVLSLSSGASDGGESFAEESSVSGAVAPVASSTSGSSSSATNPNSAKFKDMDVLRSLYPNVFVAETSRISTKPVQHMEDVFFHENQQQKRVGPLVYFPPQADVESEVGSVVGDSEPSLSHHLAGKDLVFALYKYDARETKEMSLEKGDVIEVFKRVGNWIYGAKVTSEPRSGGISGDANGFATWQHKRQTRIAGLRHASSLNNPTSSVGKNGNEIGWIPNSFVAKFSVI